MSATRRTLRRIAAALPSVYRYRAVDATRTTMTAQVAAGHEQSRGNR
ncbi:hypothetical protein STRTUCAR8_10026 [Streptomyces turgidiscabies Car8]|uniref:Uncharacterized protein n=1 Tax=Streptomyces turgidiscabies (strain Car8) TaxID=698760 RepID=L7EVX2_STRT8|nr:hypothetical protein STRTUCAR8_10026 [Streptomyces turgidiscabies Car8]